MATQINPRLARLWLADDIRQYGYKSPLKLESLSEPELRILNYLETGITTSQMSALPAIARTDEEVVDRVVAKLTPVLSESGRLPVSYSPAEVKTQFSELARLFGPQTSFADALEKRRSARIFIESIGRTGLVIANALSASEIGTLLTLDQLRVGEEDCLPLAIPGRTSESHGRRAQRGSSRARRCSFTHAAPQPWKRYQSQSSYPMTSCAQVRINHGFLETYPT